MSPETKTIADSKPTPLVFREAMAFIKQAVSVGTLASDGTYPRQRLLGWKNKANHKKESKAVKKRKARARIAHASKRRNRRAA